MKLKIAKFEIVHQKVKPALLRIAKFQQKGSGVPMMHAKVIGNIAAYIIDSISAERERSGRAASVVMTFITCKGKLLMG